MRAMTLVADTESAFSTKFNQLRNVASREVDVMVLQRSYSPSLCSCSDPVALCTRRASKQREGRLI